jgi:putative hydrolase of the HAD superfamily
MIRIILFDLDDTLYPPQSGMMDQIRDRILGYIRIRLDLSPEEADALRRHYFQVYGTTMRGLQVNHHIDADEFLHFVHDIPLRQYLQPNPLLDSVLAAVPQEKVIFTNASREHAEGVLDVLGIRHHFTRIVDVRDMNYESKPQPVAYQRVCQLLDAQPEECLMVEDNMRNLHPASALGMATILVQDGSHAPDNSVDYTIRHIEEIGDLLKEISTSAQETGAHSPARRVNAG